MAKSSCESFTNEPETGSIRMLELGSAEEDTEEEEKMD